MLDKNHHNLPGKNLLTIMSTVDENTINLVFYDNSYTKIKFVNEIISSYKSPIFYVDFDLLFSGYYESGLIPRQSNIEILWPTEKSILQIISNLIKKAVTQKSIIILDSLNGIYNILDDVSNPGRFVNSLIMFLAYNIKSSNSKLFITALSEKKENQWVLSPTKRHILETENMNKFQIKENNSALQFHLL